MNTELHSELTDRIRLIESMLSEGRRTTESWGWTFLLWGVAYYVAMAWGYWGHFAWAWPVTCIGTAILTMWIGARKNGGRPDTAAGRAISSIWLSMGVSMLLLFPAIGYSGHFSFQIFVAILGAMLGMANGACGFILRWRAEIAVASVWWISSVLACFANDEQLLVLFLVDIFLCQIVFGAYAMFCDRRRRQLEDAVHA